MLTENTHECLMGLMFIDRVPREQLLEMLQERLRSMYWQLEHEVEKETAQGCSIRPADI